VVRTDARGMWIEERTLRGGTFQRSPVIRARGPEALVGFTANPGALRTQVFLGGLECTGR
jgi:hypothetical protein